MERRKEEIYVRMLGEFSIAASGGRITDGDDQAIKPWLLLEYLLAFRDRVVPSEELMDLFWRGDLSSNPAGALKTLIFRTRKLLKPLGLPPQTLVIQRGKAFGWTKEMKTVMDTDQFEALCLASKAAASADESLSLCLKALPLYRGAFLPGAQGEAWVIPVYTYYLTLYQGLVRRALTLLNQRKDYPAVLDLCQQAILLDPYGEDAHYHLIYALHESGNQQRAMTHYRHVSAMYYDELSTAPPIRFQELYKRISQKKHGVTMDLGAIQDALAETPGEKGAFCCEPTVFRDLYQLYARVMGRTGDSIFIGLITASSLKGSLLRPSVQQRAMDELGAAIRLSLRRGDVFCRYSVSQYLLFLPTSTYENGEMVIKRIVQNFKRSYSRKDLSVVYSLQSITPREKG